MSEENQMPEEYKDEDLSTGGLVDLLSIIEDGQNEITESIKENIQHVLDTQSEINEIGDIISAQIKENIDHVLDTQSEINGIGDVILEQIKDLKTEIQNIYPTLNSIKSFLASQYKLNSASVPNNQTVYQPSVEEVQTKSVHSGFDPTNRRVRSGRYQRMGRY